MIDLSFLTDEEQETILAVLKRDADLKKAEEERIKNLQRAVKDKGLLKYLTGEWFYETKLLRHQDRIHGSDIIKASMRPRQKPLTILELSQILPEKQSFVGSDNQDIYIPPELCGLIQACTDPRERGQSLSPCEIPQVIPKPMVQSPTKQRWNPFNNERPPTNAPKGESGQVGVEPMEAEQAPSEEPSPSFDFTMSKGECHEESPGGASESIALPMPITTRVVDTSQDSLIDAEGSPGGHTNSAAPRGILKHMPNSSSTDSLSSRLAPQEATGLDSPVKTDNAKESLDWLDRKQVRFSATGRSGEQWQDGKELGEHGLLDVDSVNATEEENNNDFAKIKDTVVGLCEPLPTPRDLDIGEDGLSCESGINDQKQNDGPHQSPGDLCEQDHDESLSPQGSKLHSAQQESGKRPRLETGDEEDGQSKAKGIKGIVGFEDATMPQAWLPGKNRNKHDISVEAASDTKPLTNYSSKKPFHSVSPVSKKRLLGIFRRSGAKEKSAELVGSHKEKRPTEEELDDNAIILQTSEYADNTSGDNQINVTAVKEETKTPAPIEVRTLQLTALQNTNFKDLMSSLSSGSDYQQEPIESKDRVSKCPQRLSNLKAFWEKGNSGPKVIFTRDQAINETSTQAETDDSHNGQPAPNVESRNALRMEWTERNEAEENKAQESKARSNDKDIQKIEGNLLLDSPKQDGTYRASPILISDETDDSSAGSVTDLPSQDSVATSLHTSLSCQNDLQQGDSLIPLPTQSRPDGNQPIKITNLKSFWEKEFTGPRIIVGSARAPIQFRLGNSHLDSQVVPSYSDLKKPSSIKEEEAQSSDNESKSGVSIIKPMTVKGFVSRSSGNSQSKSDATIRTAEQPEENQFDIKREVLFSQERSLSPSRSQSPRSRDSSDDELWRSPSKTCHPKVLPRESSSPKGSPLKTFPIDFALKTKDPRSELVRPTPAARQKKTSLPEAKQPGWIDIRNSTGIISGTPVLTLEDLEQATTAKPQQTNQNTPIVRQYKKASESEPRLGDSSEVLGTHFARSFVPQDYQYYLGAPEKAHLPPFNQEEAAGQPNVNISAPATPVPTTQARSQSRASSGSELFNSLFSHVPSRFNIEVKLQFMVFLVMPNHVNDVNRTVKESSF